MQHLIKEVEGKLEGATLEHCAALSGSLAVVGGEKGSEAHDLLRCSWERDMRWLTRPAECDRLRLLLQAGLMLSVPPPLEDDPSGAGDASFFFRRRPQASAGAAEGPPAGGKERLAREVASFVQSLLELIRASFGNAPANAAGLDAAACVAGVSASATALAYLSSGPEGIQLAASLSRPLELARRLKSAARDRAKAANAATRAPPGWRRAVLVACLASAALLGAVATAVSVVTTWHWQLFAWGPVRWLADGAVAAAKAACGKAFVEALANAW